MPYSRPTLTDLVAQAQQDVASGDLLGLDPFLAFAVLPILAEAIAGQTWENYGYLDWIALQTNPASCTAPEILAMWGAIKGKTQEPATVANVGGADFSPCTPGAVVPADTPVNRSDGFAYQTSAAATASAAGTVTLPLLALATGSAGNTGAGTTMQLGTSVPGVNSSTGTVDAAGITGGTDIEDLEVFRTRVLAAWAQQPQGGALADYLLWAGDVPGVTRSWVAPRMAGAGTVTVFVMLDVVEATNGGFPQGSNGVAAVETRDIPATGDQLTVANALYPQRPVTDLVYVAAPAPQAVPFTVSGLGAANTAANQAAIIAALADMFLRLGNVGGAIDPDTNEPYGPIEPSSWYAAIASALGSSPFLVPTPSAPIQPGSAQLPVLGLVTFVS